MLINSCNKVVRLFFLPLLLLVSCKNDLTDVGVNINPNASQLNQQTLDSFNWTCTSQYVDSFATNNLSSFLLGAINDPSFGIYSASIVGQARLASLGRGFSDTSKLDSIVMYLVLDQNDRFFGDSNTLMELSVFEMLDNLDSVYYSNSNLGNLNQIGQYRGKMYTTDSFTRVFGSDTTKTLPSIRIALSETFGKKLMDPSNGNNYDDNSIFTEFIKGIAIVPNENQIAGLGGISSIDLRNFYSEIVVYYDKEKSKSLIFSNYSNLGNLYAQKNQPLDLRQQLSDSTHYDQTYAQGMGGCQIKILVRDLIDSLKEYGQDIVINQASLTLTPKEGFELDELPFPKRLNLFSLDSNGNRNITEDFFTNSLGGFFDESEKNYTFMITREIQSILNDFNFTGLESNHGFVVSIPSDNPLEASRLVLDSRKNEGIKLNIKYTVLN